MMNLVSELNYFRNMNIKPNFSALARAYKKDRHTIRKMYYDVKPKPRGKKGPCYDKHSKEIVDLLSRERMTKKSIWFYLKDVYKVNSSYSNLKAYIKNNNLDEQAVCYKKSHPFFETDPGEQAQVDWVESIKLHTTSGELLNFNLFSVTLGYSRLHYFEYSEFKTEEDFKRCLVNFFRTIGGKTNTVLTDNMSAIVSIKEGKRKIHPTIEQFFKDLNVKLKLCQVLSPQTKGKNETANKYAKWLQPYDGKLKDKDHLLEIIEHLNKEINEQINSRTMLKPNVLFQKEKEYLSPLANFDLFNSSNSNTVRIKVSNSCLVTYKGAKYSVPVNIIGKTVDIIEQKEKIYFYYNKNLVAIHNKRIKNSINYLEEHYISALSSRMKNSDDIDDIAKKNLERFKNLGDINE